MSLTNPKKVITEERLSEFYQQILPYLGGGTKEYYSTSEQVVGKWVDGKTLYQKTIYCTAMPNSSSKDYAHGISNLDRIIYMAGMANWGTGGACFNDNYDTANGLCNMRWDKTNITITTKGNWQTTNAYITIQYTKN